MRFFHFLKEKYDSFLFAFFEGPSWMWRNGGGRKKEKEKYISPSFMLYFWCRGLLNRIFTFQGWMLFWVFLASAFYSSIMIRSSITFLFLLLGGLFLINGVFLLLFSPRLRIKRRVPQRVVQGKIFTIEYEIENLSFFPCFSVLADPLLQGKGISGEELQAFAVPGRGKIFCSRIFTLEKRGVWQLPSATVETLFPFGLLKKSFCDHRKVEIFVHPLWQKFSSSNFFQSGKYGNNQGKRSGEKRENKGLSIAGCREYVYGDEIRLIHWANSAKGGKLVVKEFEEEKNTRLSVILDTAEVFSWKKLGKAAGKILHLQSFSMEEIYGKKFESLLSFAASLSGSFSPEEYEIDFYIPCRGSGKKKKEKNTVKAFLEKWILGKVPSGKEYIIKEYRTGKNGLHHTAFLDILAALERLDTVKRFENMPEEMLRKAGENPSLFLVLLSCDPAAERFYRKVIQYCPSCRVLYIGDEEDQEENIPRWAERISSKDLFIGNKGGGGRE